MNFVLSEALLTTLTDNYITYPLLSQLVLFASGLDKDIHIYRHNRRGTENLHSDNHDLK